MSNTGTGCIGDVIEKCILCKCSLAEIKEIILFSDFICNLEIYRRVKTVIEKSKTETEAMVFVVFNTGFVGGQLS